MTDLLKLVDEILVHHPRFHEATERIEQCFAFAHGRTEPVCLAIIGEARTGKSRALEACCQQHPSARLDDGNCVPILSVKVPAKPTVKGLVEVMLEAVQDPRPQHGTESERTRRLRILMKGAQTRMIMIDEFQHFFDKGTRLIQHHVTDWLKTLVDDVKCALVVAGLPSSHIVIGQNEQLAGRFLAPIQLSRFGWRTAVERAEFRAVLRGFYENLHPHLDVPEFHTEPMAFRLFWATGGLVGYLAKLIRQTVCNAISKKTKSINLEQLALAFKQCMWHEPGIDTLPNPFAKDADLEVTSDRLDQIERIGTVASPSPVSKRRTSGRGSITSANSCFVTK